MQTIDGLDFVLVPRGGGDNTILSHTPQGADGSVGGGWSSWLQKAKTKLYRMYKSSAKEDVASFSSSPIWLLGCRYGADPEKSLLESPHALAKAMLKPVTGLKTVERQYPGEEVVSRTFSGADALGWLSREFPSLSSEQAVQVMQGLFAAGLVQPFGSSVTEFVVGGMYMFPSSKEDFNGRASGGGFLRRTANVVDAIDPSTLQEFVAHFSSLVWFSYRQDFPPIEPNMLTSDVGWGCVLRCGQMLLGNALLRQMLGPSWRMSLSDDGGEDVHRRVLNLFADRPGPAVPYSIHNIAHVGTLFRKPVGEWFGPTAIANVLKLLVRKYSHAGFTFYLAGERIIYRENVYFLCQSTPPHTVESPRLDPKGPRLLDHPQQTQQGMWRPVIIMSCVRLGIDSLNGLYVDSLLELFKIPQLLGIIGGKPNASLYFVGAQEDQVIYLDPHYVQASVDMSSPASFDTSSFHNPYPQKMPCREIDPCLAIGFCCSSAAEFDDLCQRLRELEARNPNAAFLSVGDRDPNNAEKSSSGDPLSHLHFG